MADRVITTDLVGDNRSLNGALDQSASKASKTGAAVRAAGKAVAVGLGLAAVGAVAFGRAAVKASSDAQQSVGATETVFGKASDTVIRKSGQAAKAYGLSANAYRENANLIGSLFKNQGVATDQLAGKTDKMISRASDLAATFGGTTSQAVEALSSAFKGEFDPLEAYGISIKQSTINTEAYRVANVKTASAFGKLSTAQQKAAQQQATTNLINKQSAASAGAFGRETDTLAHQQQVLGAQWTDLKKKAGDALIPALTAGGQVLTSTVMPAMLKYADQAAPKVEHAIDQLGDAWERGKAVFEGAAPKGGQFAWAEKAASALRGVYDAVKNGDPKKLDALGTNVGKVSDSLSKLGSGGSKGVADTLNVAGVAMGFLADHTDALAKAMPALVVTYGLYKTAQAAANVAALFAVPLKITEMVVNRQLTKSNRELAASRLADAGASGAEAAATGLSTAAKTTGAAATGRMGAVSKVAGVAVRGMGAAFAFATGPVGLTILAIALLVTGLVIAYKKVGWFRDGVNTAFKAAAGFVLGAVDKMLGVLGSLFDVLGKLPGGAGAPFRAVSKAIDVARGKVHGLQSDLNALNGKRVSFTIQGRYVGPSTVAGSRVGGGAGSSRGGISAGDGYPARASGGPVAAGQTYLVGEQGPELFVAKSAGTIVANSKLAAKPKPVPNALQKNAHIYRDAFNSGRKTGVNYGKGLIATAEKAFDRFGARSKKFQATAVNMAKRLADRIQATQDKLAEKLAARADYVKGIRDQFRAFGDITQGEQTGSSVDLIANLRQKTQQASAFGADLNRLRKLGLSKSSMDELLAGGPEQGAAAAKALVQGGKSAVDQVNKLQKQLSATGTLVGDRAAHDYYDAGIQTTKGLLAGLKKEKKVFADIAGTMGKAVAKEIRSALGIKGKRAAGGPVAAGQRYLVGERGPEIFTPNGGGRITPNYRIGSGGGTTVIYQAHVHLDRPMANHQQIREAMVEAFERMPAGAKKLPTKAVAGR